MERNQPSPSNFNGKIRKIRKSHKNSTSWRNRVFLIASTQFCSNRQPFFVCFFFWASSKAPYSPMTWRAATVQVGNTNSNYCITPFWWKKILKVPTSFNFDPTQSPNKLVPILRILTEHVLHTVEKTGFSRVDANKTFHRSANNFGDVKP